jgi:hypothetical protein
MVESHSAPVPTIGYQRPSNPPHVDDRGPGAGCGELPAQARRVRVERARPPEQLAQLLRAGVSRGGVPTGNVASVCVGFTRGQPLRRLDRPSEWRRPRPRETRTRRRKARADGASDLSARVKGPRGKARPGHVRAPCRRPNRENSADRRTVVALLPSQGGQCASKPPLESSSRSRCPVLSRENSRSAGQCGKAGSHPAIDSWGEFNRATGAQLARTYGFLRMSCRQFLRSTIAPLSQ